MFDIKSKGVQMVLAQLIKSAAPDLIEHIDTLSTLVRDFDERLRRIETMVRVLIMEKTDAARNGQSTSASEHADRTAGAERNIAD